MEFKKKINRQGIENMAAAFILKSLLGIGFFTVLWMLRSYSVDFCLKTLEQEAQEVRENICLQISYIQNHLEMVADVIKEEDEITSERVLNLLQSNQNMGMVSRLGIVLPDDRILKPDGTVSTPVNGITFDELAKKGVFVTNIEPDNLEADRLVLFFNVPIERKGKTEGILFGVIEPQDLSNYFEVDIFDGNADIFIVDTKNREFIMDTLHGGTEKDYASKAHKIKKGYDEGQIVRDFEDGVGGITAYFSTSIKEYLYSAYEPIGINDWFVMLTVPESIVFSETKYIEKVLFWLGVYEAVVLITYFLWDIIRTRKEISAKERMATTDLLTGLKNRNAYEQALAGYEASLPASLSCVYADANGLHELNNSKGHAAGDKMLQTVAAVLVDVFDKEKVYRIGGDEFLVFAEMDLGDGLKKAAWAKEKALKAGYHVSVGAASSEEYREVAAVIKAAEQRMYVDKKRYYMEHGNRRSMRQ
ncbi:diguanylate cyclase [Lachnospiraceae bacterium WCA-9-b2]|uniref:Diguanylate cyclase n=1 Tax=Sporofaciens musculi TaxID=2681861 RepID=A0A7X3MEZ9_9FIRM|nr:diguanylate cyclase [Sporofaciens musculi]MXP75032.1 diguanylate cyclase [Sporofaciens musculi]